MHFLTAARGGAMTERELPRLTVVIEWENVVFSELERTRRMMRALREQAGQLLAPTAGKAETPASRTPALLAGPIEVLILFDEEAIAADSVLDTVDEVLGAGDGVLEIRIEAAPGLHYYDIKNLGARRASGELLLFLDSDVIPEPGWLRHLVAAARHEQVRVVGGDAFIAPENLVSKAFSVFWFFNAPSVVCPPGQPTLQPHRKFFANNVLFECATFLAHPFPKMRDGMTRGACVQLARQLELAGIPVYREPRARVSHPAPNGWRHFLVRAMAQGRDRVFWEQGNFGLRQSLWDLRCRLRKLWGALRDGASRRQYKITLAETPAIFGIGLLYFGTRLVGEIVALYFPGFVEKKFRI